MKKYKRHRIFESMRDHSEDENDYTSLNNLRMGILEQSSLITRSEEFDISQPGFSQLLQTGMISDAFIECHDSDIQANEIHFESDENNLKEEYIARHEDEFRAFNTKATDLQIKMSEIIPLSKDQDKGENVRKQQTPIDYAIMEQFLSEREARCCNGSVRLYESHYGCFEEQNEASLHVAIRACLTPEMDKRLNKQKISDVVHRIMSNPKLQAKHDDFDRHTNLINFKDCVYDIESGHIASHSSEFMFTSYIDAEFDKESSIHSYYRGQRSENFDFTKFLLDCTKSDPQKIKSLQQLTGYIISNEWRAKKFFVLLGLPHTGKSVWLTIWRSLIGPKHTTAMSLKQLGGTRFMTAELFRSKLNISAEMDENGTIKATDVIKTITGGDLLTAEKKGRDPFQFHGKTKLIAAGNYMPRLEKLDGTSAFTDRMMFLIFNNIIPEERRDKLLVDKILADKTAIVRWAIEGLLELKGNNLIFIESEDAIRFKRQYINEINNVPCFLNERCTVDIDNHNLMVHRKHLYPSYVKYCKDNGERTLTQGEFYVEIKKTGAVQTKFRIGSSTPLNGFRGIELRSTHYAFTTEEIEE